MSAALPPHRPSPVPLRQQAAFLALIGATIAGIVG